MLLVDCPFMIATSVFPNVYFHPYQENDQSHLILTELTDHKKTTKYVRYVRG